MNWQPIESAPVETPVWLYQPGAAVWIGERAYDSDGWLWGNTYMAVYQRTDGTWASTSNDVDDNYQPTHWMPLPVRPIVPHGVSTNDAQTFPQQTLHHHKGAG